MSNYIGPALPPHLKHLLENSAETETPQESHVDEDVLVLQDSDGSLSDNESNQSSIDTFGPALPPGFPSNQSAAAGSSNTARSAIGQSLPVLEDSNQSDEDDNFGPALPPGFLSANKSEDPNNSTSSRGPIGPSLPADYLSQKQEGDSFGPAMPLGFSSAGSSSSSSRAPIGPIGPALPPGFCVAADDEDDSDDDVVGPMPLPADSEPAMLEYLQKQMERRALKMKRKLKGEDEDDSKTTKRETWMLELPPDRGSEFGLGPRQFRAKAKQELGDQTVWTDTPEDKIRKQNVPGEVDTSNLDEMQLKAIADRDRAMEKFTEKHNKKKRKESLVDMHQKKMKKKKKKEEEARKGKKQERRPFDRDVDLQANRFDEAQKKAILRKAQLLDDRFSRGKSKFL